MRDQAQVELYCRADPFLLWARAIRIIQGSLIQFGDVYVSQEQKQMHRFLRVLLRNGTLLGRLSFKAQTHLISPSPRFLPRGAGRYTSIYHPDSKYPAGRVLNRDSHMGLLLGPARSLADASPSSPPAVGCRMWASIHPAAKIEQFAVIELQESKQEDGSYRVDGLNKVLRCVPNGSTSTYRL